MPICTRKRVCSYTRILLLHVLHFFIKYVCILAHIHTYSNTCMFIKPPWPSNIVCLSKFLCVCSHVHTFKLYCRLLRPWPLERMYPCYFRMYATVCRSVTFLCIHVCASHMCCMCVCVYCYACAYVLCVLRMLVHCLYLTFVGVM